MNRKKMLLISVLLGAVVLVAAACEPGDPFRSTGAYPIEIFPEMHYSPAFRSQEPDRILPPEGSIPVANYNPRVGDREQVAQLENPIEPTPETLEYAALLIARDCAMCHGGTPEDGGVGEAFVRHGAVEPPAFGSERIQALTPGEAFHSISNGFGFMPPFVNLLNEGQRWSIVAWIEATAEEREATLQAAAAHTSEERSLRLLELRNR